MAIVEAFNNAVFHAHKGNKDIFVGVKIKKEGKDMVINIRDRGKGFDIGRIREPEIFNTKGRGIFIIKNIMKKVSYSNGRLVMIY